MDGMPYKLPPFFKDSSNILSNYRIILLFLWNHKFTKLNYHGHDFASFPYILSILATVKILDETQEAR
jgi:hypothetical protein